ncbi:hypothetical protein [Alkaliphilus peptidifermentans]|uniref:Uncharacterized protein n=1 Tax=Alkaliphilus peptidifermentans DSM 18978 TaxID=1120976 RepID=A0A1G5K1X7_9FIRM|nr:hypothetical protein [Alkaliphilus peptidifermentans]SCY94464.1 hypothetical protein SAMN03080606_03176 [Alkaliphilus peptidifermentans DSM 18978]
MGQKKFKITTMVILISFVLSILTLTSYYIFAQKHEDSSLNDIAEIEDVEDEKESIEENLTDNENIIDEIESEEEAADDISRDEEAISGIEENVKNDENKKDNKNEANTKKTEEKDKAVEHNNSTDSIDSNKENKEQERLLNETLNRYVLDMIKTYPIGTPYLLNTDYANYNGVTTNLYYKDTLLLRANPKGDRASHCVGITFEVFFKAMQERNRAVGLSADDLNGMNWDQLYDFVLTWYVASSNKSTHNLTVALEKYGVGRRINNLEDARAGDFIDFSRENHTGHTVVFLNWIKDNEKIVGLRYWSSQKSTNGINYREEYFNILNEDGKKYGNIIIDQVYIGRVSSINSYKTY